MPLLLGLSSRTASQGAGGVTAPVFLPVFIRNGQPLRKFVPDKAVGRAVSCPDCFLGV